MAEYLIKGETLTAIADAIRAKSNTTSQMTPEAMATNINLVYNKGYADGQSAGGGASTPTLFGEHLIVHTPQTDINTTFTFDSETVFAWFWSVENNCWEMRPVIEIEILDGDGVYICDSDGEYNWYSYTEDEWYDCNEIPDCEERIELRILEFTHPISVPQEFYNWMRSNNGHEDQSIYEESYSQGHSDGRSEGNLEALGALCEWQITTDSNSQSHITIVNLHPSYYLHCQISDMRDGPWYDYDTDEEFSNNLVVPPDSSKTVYGDDAFSNMRPIYIDAVRWSKNGI
jgi:hypothetical protein